jgi:glutamyl-tRNA synthetase
MDVNLVLRGDDHLPNTPRQILLLEAFGFEAPRYAHVSLLLGMDGVPLSKRLGATSLKDFRDRGYLPEALANHLLRLGHTSAHEGWIDPAAMPANFSLDRLGRAGARFDEAQLRHWQREAVARLSEASLAAWLQPFVPAGVDPTRLVAFYRVIKPNLEFPEDVVPWFDVVFGELKVFSPEARAAMAEAGVDFFSTAQRIHEQTGNDLKALARELGTATGRRGPALYMPLRAVLSGSTHGPELGPLLALMPPALVQERFSHAARR